MKKILIVSTLFALAAVSVQAQGLINFINGSTTKISTNAVVGGPATGGTAVPTTTLRYRYALYYSTTAAAVNGQTAAFDGAASVNYAFNDTNWTLVTYGTNFQAGEFISAASSTSGSGTTVVPGVAGGSAAKFVVIGWSVSIGTNIAALQGWFGNPSFNGWIGQSEVSGSITLGTSIGATLFGTSTPEIAGFTLGLVVPSASVAPVITSQPSNETVATGASANFTVGAYGTPSPAYQWMFNGTNVIAGATTGTLTINDVQSTNAGTYSVVITNAVGSTNSFAATLTVTAPSGVGYVIFANSSASATKIYTNSSVGGAATGLTVVGNKLYSYALFISATATSVLGQTSAVLGSASTNYAFNDTNWTLAGYGSNSLRGQFVCVAVNGSGFDGIPRFASGTTAQFVVIGWSGNIGWTNIADVQTWFNGGSPASNGWIGQSAVSGPITLGNNAGSIPTPLLFGTNAPYLQGFTLGLASPTLSASYAVPYAPPAIMQTHLSGNIIQLSWPAASGSFGVKCAPSPAGPWTDDTGLTPSSDGTTSSVTVTNTAPGQFYRLVAQ